ncbi:MAG: FAD:protein FMN transferase, partial [Kiritimatiellae bacterium]|nr:FAD:protein FMN transferase [Kiritimatiellia bacterium]
MAEENHRFCHDAMNCPYEVIIVGHTQDYARQASSALFDELDQMEQRLSRFIDHSDIGRIRSLNPGESTCVSPDTMDCLLAALWVHRETAGAFDVSLGQGLQHVMPDPGRMTVTLSSSYDGPVFDLDDADKEWGMKLDLGGIGKGHALDRMIDMLGEWGIENALVSAGGSTVLSVGRNGAEEWAIG